MKKNYVFVFILSIVLTILIQFAHLNTGKNDFLAYWSAARLFVTGGHPYDHSSLVATEQYAKPELISQGDVFLNTWNPPWLILMFVPLGALPFPIAANVWIFFNTVLIGIALIVSWQMSSSGEQSRGILIVFVVSYLFGVTIAYIAIGQITALVLLGILLSIWWLKQQRDFLAGAILLLPMLKPQISFFILVILFIWIIQKRRWKVALGFLIALISSLLIFWIFYSTWVTDYLTLIQSMPFRLIYTSTLGSFMDYFFHTKIFYFSAIILIFFIKPILRIVNKDGLFTAMNLSMLISLPLSPFGFTFDQIVILPAIVQIISWLWEGRLKVRTIRIIIVFFTLFYLFVYFMFVVANLEYFWFFVIPVLLLPIYLFPWKMSHESQS
jgi:hypothetical protein